MKEKRRTNKKYSPEFKISVILDMREHHLGYCETVRKHFNIEDGKEVNYYHRVQRWERIYLEEGEAGFYIERRGRATKMDMPLAFNFSDEVTLIHNGGAPLKATPSETSNSPWIKEIFNVEIERMENNQFCYRF